MVVVQGERAFWIRQVGLVFTAATTFLIARTILRRQQARAFREDMDKEKIEAKPGVGPSQPEVQRKSYYEGAGDSYLGRRPGNRFT